MSDYFRNYFSYRYGGAYHDIKSRSPTQSIAECWNVFKDPNIWVVGMPEIQGGVDSYNLDVADYIKQQELYQPDIRKTKAGYRDANFNFSALVSNGAWVARPETPLFKKVNSYAERRLDGWLDRIKLHPVPNFKRCCLHGETPGYPVGWTALQGTIFHPYQAVYHSHISRSMPWFNMKLYTDKSENVLKK